MSVENGPGGVSMKDIAKACGVSVVTVSRALKGDRNHSAETRARIVKAAEQMGYRPSPLVSALMSARGRHKPAKTTVNLAMIDLSFDWPGHPFYEGVMAQARALGYSIDRFALTQEGSGERLRRIMLTRGVKGVIVMPAPQADRRLAIDLSGFATATIGYSVVSPHMPRVVTDTFGRITEVLTRAEQRGYRRIGILGTDDLDRRFQHLGTAAALVYAHTNPGVMVDCLNLDPTATDTVNCRQVVKWVKKHKLDVIMAQAGLYAELRGAGLRIPADLGYVHLHWSADPTITCMDQNQEWIGRKATDVVVGMINRNEFQLPEQSQTIMIPSRWVEGTTLPVRGV